MSTSNKQNAVDLSHHLSELSKKRLTSPLKGAQKYFTRPGMIQMIGGLPNPAYFPLTAFTADTLVPESFHATTQPQPSAFEWLWNLLGTSDKPKTSPMTIPKFGTDPEQLDLAKALQYGPATGQAALQNIIQEFTARVYQPAYADFKTLVHIGNTDGWFKAVFTLCNPGEGVLFEEWSYPSAMFCAEPLGLQAVPIKMDGEGMSPSDLKKVLSEWSEEERGFKRPHVMYTVPVGQNPTGATMGEARKNEIYEICVEYDIIIVEDDPYYFLQEGPYVAPSMRPDIEQDSVAFIQSLAPSYLRVDYQGRVIRLDTFSKTIAPGSRCGWFTCNPLFAERLERQAETTTQAPAGWSQAFIATLIGQQWKLNGYVRWLQGLRLQYRIRRDNMIDAFFDEFSMSPRQSEVPGVWQGSTVFEGRSRPRGITEKFYGDEKRLARTLISFAPPTSGMFVWVKVHLESLPSSSAHRCDDPEDPLPTPEEKLWTAFAEAGILVGPGMWFSAHHENGLDHLNGDGHYRLSFSTSTPEDIRKGVRIFRQVIEKFFHDES